MSPGRIAGTVAAVVAVVLAMWAIGFAAVNIALGAVAAAAVAALVAGSGPAREQSLPELPDARRGGHRQEVSQISWSLTGRDGRVGEHGMRRLRAVAHVRLTTAGIDPADDAAVRAALGDRAWHTLRTNEPPSVRALEACLTALEKLEGARS